MKLKKISHMYIGQAFFPLTGFLDRQKLGLTRPPFKFFFAACPGQAKQAYEYPCLLIFYHCLSFQTFQLCHKQK